MHPADSSKSQSTAGSHEKQQNVQPRSLAPLEDPSSQGGVGPSGLQQHVSRPRAPSAAANGSAAPDREAARQQRVPHVPLIPETDPLYKKVLCMYHKQGRCPRGDTCSFAHGVSELRRKPGQQVHNLLP